MPQKQLLFCDSLILLEEFLANKDIEDFEIRSFSPAVLHSNLPNIQQADKKWDKNLLKDFQSSIYDFSLEIFNLLNQDKDFSRFAHAGAIEMVRFHRDIYRISTLVDNDLQRKIKHITLDLHNNKNPRLAALDCDWLSFFKDNNNLEVEYMEYKEPKNLFSPSGSISLNEKLALKDLKQTLLKLYKRFSINFSNKTLYILRENELLNDIAADFMLKGYKIETLRPPIPETNIDIKLSESIKNNIRNIFSKLLDLYILPSLHDEVYQYFLHKLSMAINTQESFTSPWKEKIQSLSNESVVFCGYPSMPSVISLASLKNRPPIASFQHGSQFLSPQGFR